MAFYMIQGTYTTEAWAAMTKNPQDRRIPIREMAQKLGGRLIDVYYCFGEYDVVVLAELPDDNAALTTAIAGVIPGHLKTYKTTRLFTVEETMEAMRKAGGLVFPGPSRG
ncbi:MAG TPA: GYD domain-containing protein [Ktedonobacteraceae bacterium]|nr:GYD domain-containing protein [Ktedonobacteraceae bacterium]